MFCHTRFGVIRESPRAGGTDITGGLIEMRRRRGRGGFASETPGKERLG